MRERCVDPNHGIPGEHSFLPDLATVRKWCQALVDDQRRHDELVEKNSRPRLANTHQMPEIKNSATYSALCERFGLKAIPPGWDAVDVTRAAAQYGDQLASMVDQMKEESLDKPKSAFSRAVEHAREAMQPSEVAE